MADKIADVLAKYFKDPIDAECSYCEAAKEVTRIVRAEVTTLFADKPAMITFIRSRDGKASVEECYLIIKSEWQEAVKR